MSFPTLTALYAAVLSLMFAALSIWVVAGRGQFRIHHGDGGKEAMNRRIRAHGNFAEYVPLILLLAAFLEGAGAGHRMIHALLAPLVVARLMHPIGMLAREGSLQQFAFRGVAALATFVILTTAAVLLLLRLLSA